MKSDATEPFPVPAICMKPANRRTVMDHTQIAVMPRDSFMRAAKNEMAKFERREIEFRQKDREERAAELQIPLPRRQKSSKTIKRYAR
jgi:hypothetical protein